MTSTPHKCALAAAFFCALALLGACPDPELQIVEISAAERGGELFKDATLSGAVQNRLACADCHDSAAVATPGLSGAPLAGVTARARFWGGQENDLLRSINDCLFYFMFADSPWTGEEEEAIQIYAYLESLEAEGDASPQPFTIGPITNPDAGDAARGEAVYASACASCHGARSTAEGRLLATAPTLPEETLANHPDPEYDDVTRRLVFVEKIRHGGFLGYGGQMPPLSLEVLSEEDMADLLTYMGVP